MGLQKGEILAGRFRVENFVDAGGMGAVYRVWDLQRKTWLAMKVLHADMLEDPGAFRRFQREAELLKRLHHPHVVPFYGLYRTGDLVFLLEDFIDGETLKQILRREGHLTTDQALIVLRGVSAALSYSHEQGVVHCDVKPGNVLVDHGGDVFLGDFGIARYADHTTTTLAGAGTPAYMAPEQFRGERLSPATDVYALGVMAYELLVGRRPFTGREEALASLSSKPSSQRLRVAHLTLPPPDPREFRADLSPAVSGVLLKALAKAPEERYQDAWLFFKDLAASMGREAQEVPKRLRLTVESQTPAPATVTVVDQTVPDTVENATVQAEAPLASPSRRTFPAARLLGLGGVAVLLLAVLVFAGVAVGRKAHPTTTPTTVVMAALSTATETLSPSKTPAETPTQARPTQLSLATATLSPTLSPSLTPSAAAPETVAGSVRRNPRDGAQVVFIPAGTFTMGLSPAQVDYLRQFCSTEGCELLYRASTPAHQVYEDSFWIYRIEVTNAMYQKCVAAGGCSPPRRFSSERILHYYDSSAYAHYPVTYVSWSQARDYCHWAGGRLPTSAEWEYAGRGASDTRLFPWGNDYPTSKLANVEDIFGDLLAVGSFPDGASPFGVLDMSGNVWEWVQDWFSETYYATDTDWNNPTGPSEGDFIEGHYVRAGRGGNYWTDGALSSVAIQDWADPGKGYRGEGFRCVLDNAP